MLLNEKDIPTMETENNSQIIEILCVHLNRLAL